MDLKWNPGSTSHPASAALQVTDCSWPDTLDPSPLLRDEGELLLEEYLSPRKLRALTGVDDLQAVTALEVRVDTRDSSLGSLGAYLPSLRELKLNDSLLVSVRDLGTTLAHLQVLWLARCGLSDLDGISSCSSLKELYIAYNNISDLSQLPWLDHLEVLDLEGNNIEDINQMQYLRLCDKLRCLTVEGNLICLRPTAESAEEPGYNYRAAIRRLIPHLEYLDAAPVSQTEVLPPKPTPEDWLLIEETIQEGGLAGDTSWLGLSQDICGKATKALGARRQELGPPAVRALNLGGVRTENLSGSASGSGCGSGGGGQQQEDEFPVPGAQTEQQKRCLQTAQHTKATLGTKVTPSDEEKSGDCKLTDSCEDELRESRDEDLVERISLDSSGPSWLCHTSSGSALAQEAAVFPSLIPCLIPSPPKSPSPASVTAARPWKRRSHRGRCLKLPSQEAWHWTQPCQPRAQQEASAQPVGKDLAPLSQLSLQAASRAAPSTHQPQPASGLAAVGCSTRPTMDGSPPGETTPQQPAVCSAPEALQRSGLLSTNWPLTARAKLPSLPARPTASASQSTQPQAWQLWSLGHSLAFKD
ncbi:leucine-rich repeat-containing protein 56 [Indicator indicator]|uniref:leucine-rich repeat-containing protein 56 n=1 Tax=Indicator indicator TaxID=1002788 RepID=UPI0023DF1E50|nr:leucine-rich repeat-containing protein 56 [Indicator indicator]